MAGGTPGPAALSMDLGAQLLAALRGTPCRVYSSDLRVRVSATGLTTYPDLTVVCGELETDPESEVTVTNPRLVVEVLSPSTEGYDRGEKLEHYQQIPSLEACLLVSQADREVTLFTRRSEASWSARTLAPGEALTIGTHEVVLDLDALYDDAGL